MENIKWIVWTYAHIPELLYENSNFCNFISWLPKFGSTGPQNRRTARFLFEEVLGFLCVFHYLCKLYCVFVFIKGIYEYRIAFLEIPKFRWNSTFVVFLCVRRMCLFYSKFEHLKTGKNKEKIRLETSTFKWKKTHKPSKTAVCGKNKIHKSQSSQHFSGFTSTFSLVFLGIF